MIFSTTGETSIATIWFTGISISKIEEEVDLKHRLSSSFMHDTTIEDLVMHEYNTFTGGQNKYLQIETKRWMYKLMEALISACCATVYQHLTPLLKDVTHVYKTLFY